MQWLLSVRCAAAPKAKENEMKHWKIMQWLAYAHAAVAAWNAVAAFRALWKFFDTAEPAFLALILLHVVLFVWMWRGYRSAIKLAKEAFEKGI
jgi:hypothetical protein